MENNGYLLVLAKDLPPVYGKVVLAKRLLAQGKAKNASQAAKLAGISRSAYYKYKDSVHSYDRELAENIINISLKLEDEPGILSSVLVKLSQIGINIITVNQNIPVDGVAPVSISAKLYKTQLEEEELMEHIRGMTGVVEARSVTSR